MKLMIASDIHGSAKYCRQLLEAYDREKPDKLIILGDILYHGPRNDLPEEYAPKKVIEMLNPMAENLLCVRGNGDTEVDQMVLDFPVLADYALVYVDGHTMFLTHGHVYNRDNLPKIKEGDILVNGHTHVPVFKKEQSYTYVNPGSVSIPKENSERSYIIYEKEAFIFKDLSGHEYAHYNYL